MLIPGSRLRQDLDKWTDVRCSSHRRILQHLCRKCPEVIPIMTDNMLKGTIRMKHKIREGRGDIYESLKRE